MILKNILRLTLVCMKSALKGSLCGSFSTARGHHGTSYRSQCFQHTVFPCEWTPLFCAGQVALTFFGGEIRLKAALICLALKVHNVLSFSYYLVVTLIGAMGN